MRPSFFLAALLGTNFLLPPHPGLAQKGSPAPGPFSDQPRKIKPGSNARFVMLNEEVVQQTGRQTTHFNHNLLLPGGTKINVRSGIIQYDNGKGKATTLHPGDYVNAKGKIVFSSPAAAQAAAAADAAVAASSAASIRFKKMD